MIKTEQVYTDLINSPVRNIRARVELYNGSTLLNTFKYTDKLKSFNISRAGDNSKFFGYGICQRLNVKLIDTKRELDISTDNRLETVFGAGSDYMYPCPYFQVSEVRRDEKTNELSITAYDALYKASERTVSELNLKPPYTIADVVTRSAGLLGLPVKFENSAAFQLSYPKGANFEAGDSLRSVLDAIAEVTQTIYYVNNEWQLEFKKLAIRTEPELTITKDKYIALDCNTNRRLANICHATELGDNVEAKSTFSGSTQYIRDNPFWELREDITTLVEKALAQVAGLTINQFDCQWRGNFLLEIGDRIALIQKDDQIAYSYLLNDEINYDGTLSQRTQWKYEDNEEETASNPTSLGDVVNHTFAKVNKVNKQIDLVVYQQSQDRELIESNKTAIQKTVEDISNIRVDVGSVSTEVKRIESNVTQDIDRVESKVNQTITNDQLKIEIEKLTEKGANKIHTGTGYTFDETGMTISKSGKEMSTQITEDGMKVFKDGVEVLTANNIGVDAKNLHATTYLIIGQNSRFEDYDNGNRTGCFWIG